MPPVSAETTILAGRLHRTTRTGLIQSRQRPRLAPVSDGVVSLTLGVADRPALTGGRRPGSPRRGR